ncbi:hypothetical protein IFT64_18925 [Oxalobacteraceae sp. CFBP 8753]|nr:hypothetical protein [Oxalobacteraceae sp. CFBP 8753]
MTEEVDSSADDFLWNERRYVEYRVELSVRYHRKRERFFALCDRCSKAVSLIAGTAAFSSLLPTANAKSVAGLVVALGAMPALVMAWGDRARLHGELAQKFLAIEAEIVRVGKRKFTEEQVNEWHAQLLGLEASEPPTLGALEALCHNYLMDSCEEPERKIALKLRHRLFMHIFDFHIDWSNAKKKKDGEEAQPVAGAVTL